MRRWQKIVASLWTTILIAPILLVMVAYLTGTCGEYDPCPTGGHYPHRLIVIILIAGLVALQLAFLAMVWTISDGNAQSPGPE